LLNTGIGIETVKTRGVVRRFQPAQRRTDVDVRHAIGAREPHAGIRDAEVRIGCGQRQRSDRSYRCRRPIGRRVGQSIEQRVVETAIDRPTNPSRQIRPGRLGSRS
jgi:hypothetical protein